MQNNALNAGKYTRDNLDKAGVLLDNPELPELLDQAGGGLSVDWLKRSSVGLVGKLTIRHAIGLRRLLGVPVDTIIGLEYTRPVNRDRMAGLRRIRHELGGRKPLTHKNLLERLGCSAPITRRIELFSTWAVINNASDINTPAADVAAALRDTFSIPILISLKWAIHNNIDDILGLGDYDPAIFTASETPAAEEVPDSDIMDAEAKKAHDARIIAQFASSRADKQADSDTITGFSPKAL
jgi:hypothetical protein